MFDEIIQDPFVKVFRLNTKLMSVMVQLEDETEFHTEGHTFEHLWVKLKKLITTYKGLQEEIENRKAEIPQERL